MLVLARPRKNAATDENYLELGFGIGGFLGGLLSGV